MRAEEFATNEVAYGDVLLGESYPNRWQYTSSGGTCCQEAIVEDGDNLDHCRTSAKVLSAFVPSGNVGYTPLGK